jgi:signal transduction histidine kinase
MRPDGDDFPVAPVDLVALVRRLLALERCACETHAFHLCARVQVIGLWNEPRVARIIRNLVSNAVKYSPDGSDIVVEIDRCAEYAVIRVHDQGIGIPSVDSVSVFAPYHRATNATYTAEGDGLGLTSAAKLAESLGGTLEHYPRPEGGTTFTLRLPLD